MEEPDLGLEEILDLLQLIKLIKKIDMKAHLTLIRESFENEENGQEKLEVYAFLIEVLTVSSVVKYKIFPQYETIIQNLSTIYARLKVLEQRIIISNN